MRRLAFLLFLLTSFLGLLASPLPVFAACSPPTDYRDCQSSPFGTNGVALMDSQYKPIETDFAKLRELANQSDTVAKNQRIQATIILTDGTIADQQKTLEIFRNAEKYGIDMTIRTWGNDVETPVATKMGSDLAASVAQYKRETGNDIRIELGNEPNLETSGTNYARAFAAFAQSCTSCDLYLPSMGGTSLEDKEKFIRDFATNASALSLVQKADGIVFNSYADDPREAVSDWVKTVGFWEKAGVNTINMRYFLTEVGPSVPEPDRQGLDQFLAGVAAEFQKIKSNPSDPLYRHFQKLDGLTYFIWDKKQRLYLYYVDEKGNVRKNISLPSANVPGLIPLDTFQIGEGGPKTLPYSARPTSEEYAESCPREEPVIGPEKNIAPNYRTFDSKIQPEMRNDAGLNYRSGGVLGAFCGTSKGTPILLREEAPYRLKDVPQCKVVGWAGELQFNYDDPGAIGAPVPFAQEIADQLEGDWSAPFVREEEMDRKEKLATEAETSGFINIARAKAISEIERRNGILKMILSSQQQDQMKCDLVEYVGIKGGQSVYANFRIEGRLMSSIPCPPNVTNPTGYTDKERVDWDKVWATKWKRIPLVPNEYSVGDWRHIVCDDRIYSGIGAYPEVMRLGLSANALWKQLTPAAEQQRFFAAGYQAMRDPLRSKELLGFALRRRRGPQQLPLPPVPYLVNKTMDQLAKDADTDPQCRVKETPRPTFDNGRCMHFVPSGQYNDDTLNDNVKRMKDLGVTWTLALYDDENVLRRAADAFGKAGIMPVWRKYLRADQAPAGYPWDRDIAIMKQHGNNDVKQYGPMIQLYNEPGDSREWADGVVKFPTYLTNFAAMSQRIMAAGGRVGIQLQDPAELVALIGKIKSDSSINQKDYWNKIFFVPHLYNERHAPNWTADEIGVLGFRPFAEVFQKELGFVPPMIVGEGGPEVKDHPNDDPKVTREMHAAWVSEVYNWFANGKVSDGRPLPDYLLGFCNWVIDAAGKTEFQNFAWYNNLSGGDLTQTINAVKNLPNVERKFSCEKPQSLVPFIRTHLASLRALVPRVSRVFAQADDPGFEQGCGGLSLDMQVEVVNPDPNNFVYALRMSRNACSPKGTLGDFQINPPKNYELANPGKTGPHIVSITGEGLYFLNTYEGASGFMPPVRSVEELNQYTWTLSADRFPEGHRFHDVALSYTGIINPSGPGVFAGGRCDTTKQCCETITCEYALPRPSQLGPSDTGGNFGDRYSAGHKILGADWNGKTSKYSYNPVKLIWKVPAWHAGERPLPGGCSIVVENPKTAPTCEEPGQDGYCASMGFEACNEQQGSCGNIYCLKVHDRVVDSYQSVPFLDSAWKQLAGSALNDRFFGVYTMLKSPVFKGTAAKAPETGCTMNMAQVFDRKGDFMTNPGAGEVTYGFDQGFGVGAGRGADYNNFGIGEVTVYQVLPEKGKKAKVLFYRLGGLCNATLWLSQAMMSPIAITNPGLLAQVPRSGSAQTGAVSPPGGGSSGVGSFGSITQQPSQKKTASVVPATAEAAQKVTAQVNTLIPGAPAEMPTVYTVVNTSILSLLDGFWAVAVGDHVLVYEKSRHIILLRPAANTIISQPQPLLVGLRNGSSVAAALDKFLAELRLWLPHVIVVERADAVKKDYTKTLLVLVDGSKRSLAQAISTTLDLTLADLPPGEPASAAQLLFIVGSL